MIFISDLDDVVGRLSSISDSTGTLEALGMDTVVVRSHPQTGVSLSYVRAGGEPTGDAGDQYTGIDRFGRLVDQKWVNASGTAVHEFKYAYDLDGNVLTKADPLHTVLNASYSHDGLNRLQSETKGSVADRSWALDDLGNSTSVITAGTASSRANNDQNQLSAVNGVGYYYVANGNQTGQSLPADFKHDARPSLFLHGH